MVTSFHEKADDPPSNLANGAVYIVEPSLLDDFVDQRPPVIDFSTEVIPQRMGRIYTYLNDTYHRDIGTPKALELANYEYCNFTKLNRPGY